MHLCTPILMGLPQNESVIAIYKKNHMDNMKIRLGTGFYNLNQDVFLCIIFHYGYFATAPNHVLIHIQY